MTHAVLQGDAVARLRGLPERSVQLVVTSPPYLGWRRTCAHEGEPVPSLVADPFSGSGSTGIAAHLLGRSYTGIELNPRYVEMSNWRLGRVSRNEDVPAWYTEGREVGEPVPQAQGRLAL